MNHILKIGAATALAATALSFTASAADAESAWTLTENNGASFLYMADASGPSVTLSCSDKMGVQAVVYLDGNSVDDLGFSKNSKVRSRKVALESETTEPRDGTWAYLRNAKVLISTRGWQGKRIFNAAVTGSSVSMDVFRIGTVSITPPTVNDDFRSFVSECDSI